MQSVQSVLRWLGYFACAERARVAHCRPPIAAGSLTPPQPSKPRVSSHVATDPIASLLLLLLRRCCYCCVAPATATSLLLLLRRYCSRCVAAATAASLLLPLRCYCSCSCPPSLLEVLFPASFPFPLISHPSSHNILSISFERIRRTSGSSSSSIFSIPIFILTPLSTPLITSLA